MSARHSAPSHPSLRDQVTAALEQWHKPAMVSPLQELYLFGQQQRQSGGTSQQATNQLLHQALEELAATHPQEAHLLRRRFADNELVFKVANEFNLSQSTLFRHQNEALTHLTAVIEALEQQAQAAQRAQLYQRLDLPTYSQLIGVEASLAELTGVLTRSDGPWLVLIHGLGGIGKTALADALARHLLAQGLVQELGWVTARQQLFNLGGSIKVVEKPALTTAALVDALCGQLLSGGPATHQLSAQERLNLLSHHLKSTPYLIFIDNLESVLDLETLLPQLRQWANPTRFVLTSRLGLLSEPDIYHWRMQELSSADALRFVHELATQCNLPAVLKASAADLRPIVETVGGNPLALRLVVGQLHVHSLAIVLAALRQGHTPKVEQFYTYLYQRAWADLTELERNTLLLMPMTTEEGGTLAYLTAVSGLALGALTGALERLVTLNLVDSRGDLHERRYSIHNLTRTFLHRQVAQWQ